MIIRVLFFSVAFLASHALLAQAEASKSQNLNFSDSEGEATQRNFLEFQPESEYRKELKPKVEHAEPIVIDLIRDLGARKGENEWNVGSAIYRNRNYDYIHALVEYEFAIIDRLGLEIELPFSFYNVRSGRGENTPQNNLNSLQLAAQYTFLVSEKHQTSLALGYLHEFEVTPFATMGIEPLYTGNVYSPFFVGAKRWGSSFHTLIYTGPLFFQNFKGLAEPAMWQINTSFHYMPKGQRSYFGVEVNQLAMPGELETMIHPSFRYEVAHNFLIGLAVGIPVLTENRGMGSFVRIVYEPEEWGKNKRRKPMR
ncbi:MAG: HAEPLYID family protein [Luteibaculaceae bacterium]